MLSKVSKVMAVTGIAGSLLFAAPVMASAAQCKGLNTCVPATLPAPPQSAPKVSAPPSPNCECSTPTLVYVPKTVTTKVPVTVNVSKSYTVTVPVTTYVTKTTTVQVAYYKLINPDYACGCTVSVPQVIYVEKTTGICYVTPGGELYNNGYTRQPLNLPSNY